MLKGLKHLKLYLKPLDLSRRAAADQCCLLLCLRVTKRDCISIATRRLITPELLFGIYTLLVVIGQDAAVGRNTYQGTTVSSWGPGTYVRQLKIMLSVVDDLIQNNNNSVSSLRKFRFSNSFTTGIRGTRRVWGLGF